MAEMVRVSAVRNRKHIVVVPARLARAMVKRGTHVYVDRVVKPEPERDRKLETQPEAEPAAAPEREYKRRDMEAEE